MTDADAPFLAAIRAAPGDPQPHTVYADWLFDQPGRAPEAALRYVLLDPGNDSYRLAYADRLEETTGAAVECQQCCALPAWADAELKARVDELMSGGVCGDGIGPGNTAKRINAETGRSYTGEGIHAVWQRGKPWHVEKCPACCGTGRASDGRRERAEFIRVQVRLEHKRNEASPRFWDALDRQHAIDGTAADCKCEYHALRRRERELLNAHAAAWLSPSPLGYGVVNAGAGQYGWAVSARQPGLGERYCPTVFRRGFVAEIICEAADLLAHAAAVFGAAPVTNVMLSDAAPAAGYPTSGTSPLHDGRPFWYYGSSSPSARQRHWIPRGIGKCLVGGEGDDNDNARYYPTVADAIADLSRAAVAWGRQQAGLPAWGPAGVPAGA